MSHDFGIYFNEKPVAYFFGYANGIMYSVFEARKFDGGVSGKNGGKTITVKELKEGLEKIKNSDAVKNYPDPDRFPDFFNTVEKWLSKKNIKDNKKVYIHFS